MTSVAQFIAARLPVWDVDRVFGVPGGTVDPLVTALAGDASTPEFVQARHEESAALMACAHGKLTGRTGCCLAGSGPGALRLLGGLYDAALDRCPVLAVVGDEPVPAGVSDRRRAVPASQLFAHVSEYSERVTDPALVATALDRALRAAVSGRGVATLVVPRAVLDAEVPAGLRGDQQPTASPLYLSPPVRPSDRDVRRVANLLNGAERVAVVVGPDAAGAAGQIREAAELLGAGLARTPLGRDVLPDDLPQVTGVAAAGYGSAPAAALVRDCDTLLLVGAHDFDTVLLPDTGPRHVISLDADRGACPVDDTVPSAVRLTGHVATALDTLLPLLRRQTDRRWLDGVEQAVREWHAQGRTKARRFYGMAVSPRSVVAELSARLPDRTVVVTDSGTALDWWTRHLRLRDGMRAALSRHLGTPGAAVPYALAARLAFPDRPVVALIGDGALQAGGMNELITVRRHLERLAELPPTLFCVLNNEDLSRLTWERRTAAGDPRIPATGEVPAVSYTDYAGLLGLPAIRCERPGEVAPVWQEALAGRGPKLLEFLVDGDTPPDWAEPAEHRDTVEPVLGSGGTGAWRRRIATTVSDLFGSA
ncbi:thiamine pyrophosphate-binding protein [Streptomyces sp. NPDC100445]|uniref:thiamine pyrophosphate-binding protein n=1 Tax=Streptomyces sp. NPDC100445 TaxID=3366102 RepID=UPI0038211BA2